MSRYLLLDYEKCTGCRLCELVCSVWHEGVANPARARIKVVKWEWEGRYCPITCLQCLPAPCQLVCPAKALSRDEDLERVVLDYDRCLGCRLCLFVCPFGGLNLDPVANRVIRCDLCDGEPQCARFCEAGAVRYVEAERIHFAYRRVREAARRRP